MLENNFLKIINNYLHFVILGFPLFLVLMFFFIDLEGKCGMHV